MLMQDKVFEGPIRKFIHRPILEERAFKESSGKRIPIYEVNIVKDERILATSRKPWWPFRKNNRFRSSNQIMYISLRAYICIRETARKRGPVKVDYLSLDNLADLCVLNNSYDIMNLDPTVECYRRGILIGEHVPSSYIPQPF